MKKNRNFYQKGMTLIELLIVMVIIGLISTLVLGAISSSRDKGYDSQAKQQMTQFRNAAEIYFYNQDPDSYGTPTSLCNEAGTMFTDTDTNNGNPAATISSSNLPAATQLVCQSSGTRYAIKASLSGGASYYCVDSRGRAEIVAGPIGVPVDVCP